MPAIHDDEFGKITIRRSVHARLIRIRVAPDATLRVSMPKLAPLFMAKRLIALSRDEIRRMLQEQVPPLQYIDGMTVGKSHSLTLREGDSLSVRRSGLRIIATLPVGSTIEDADVQSALREGIQKALRREAKGYLPKRLSFLADRSNSSYSNVRFSHSSSRWGSCSSAGTISLNIALMKLPFELIDYVLIHELAHTKHMNHSARFWHEVSLHDPQYEVHKVALKRENPII
jgi:predicted metal-dependent hydrolase